MKIKILYIGLSIFLLSWIIPSLVQLTLDSSSRYPFTYYSSVINQFCYIDVENDNVQGKDMSGKEYTDAEFDRVLPMFYYRQLAMENALPDSIQGVPVDLHSIARNNFFFWYKPKDKNTPVIELYPMFESCSGKVDLENPSDMFRLKDKIEFIDMATNQVDEQKSARFQQALQRAGFTAPAQWVAGIPTSQKAYDEGYFVLDSQGRLLHVKMTNGKPFVKDTKAGETINVSCMFPMDIENKSLYGFLFDTNHTLYYLSTDGYGLVKVLENVDPDKDRVSIMANMFFWTVVKESADGEYTYALKNENMQQVDILFRPARQSQWDKTLPYLFPFTVNFQDNTNSYVYPRISGYYFPSFGINIILTLLTFVLYRKEKSYGKYLASIITLFTGFAGFITVCILARLKK
ncbi:DUF4857 domain-containing protein [Butyricimonas paravirosa]|uniref:DUF4857 domain-containing protein n=1 Tax=Butyricimonas paravirosa TaxID=1472417 RepID=UPI002108F4C0|nr:DUF4857 domain-containing protein [Butyricimonas paravirosa]MCQ4873396.1 DUF4857 domain-containing protein [Butyricimonas paravirosa]